jgi:NPCBM-associated, NEW3 domain of alpha-galactosidase
MRSTGLLAAPAIAAGFASLLFVVPAHANFVARGSDPAGDASDASPGRDLTDIAVAYDRATGALKGTIGLRGAPTDARSFLTLAAGTRTATGCDGYPAGVFGTYTDETDAGWFRLDAPGAPSAAHGDAEKIGYDDQVQDFSAEAPELAHQPFDCVTALVSEPGNAANVYDVAGPLDLLGRPALGLRLKGVPKRLKAGTERTVRLTISNTGDGPARAVKLQIERARGLHVKPRRRSLPALAPGARRTVRLELRLGQRARSETNLKVVARAGDLIVRGRAPIHRIEHGRSGGGGGGTPSSCVQYSPDPFGTSGGALILVPCLR